MKKKNQIVKRTAVALGLGLLIVGVGYNQHNKSIKAMPVQTAITEQATATNVKDNKASPVKIKPGMGIWPGIDKQEISFNSAPGIPKVRYNSMWINASATTLPSEELLKKIEALLGFTGSDGSTPVDAKLSDVKPVTPDVRGKVKLNVLYNYNGTTYPAEVPIYIIPNEVFGDDGTGWEVLQKESKNGYIENPLNKSKIGFPHKGITLLGIDSSITDTGFVAADLNNKGYVYSNRAAMGTGRTATIPYINGKLAYDKGHPGDSGIGKDDLDRQFESKNFYRKDGVLKQILIDPILNVIYVVNLKLEKNLNFSMNTLMFNLDKETRTFAMLDATDTDYYDDYVPIYALGDNAGFYFQPDPAEVYPIKFNARFSVKLKRNGEWLSDYQKWKVQSIEDLAMSRFFGDDFLGTGMENSNFEAGKQIFPIKPREDDSTFAIGTIPKVVKQGEALVAGYELFVGEELPYMGLVAKPSTFNVYNNQPERNLNITYDITKIPGVGESGELSATYPEGQEEKMPFVADAELSAKNQPYSIKLDNLPNDQVGSIKEHIVDLIAVLKNSSPMNGLPSNDFGVKVNVYNFGGTGKLQTIQKDAPWVKEPSELITNPVALPGHAIDYKFENGKPDTSIEGLQWTEVRMTDKNELSQTKVIKVPVMVINGPLPTELLLVANDIYINKNDVLGMTSNQIETYILKQSNAIGFDITTGLSDGVELSVKSTTLTGNPNANIEHSAIIQASKDGYQSTTQSIKIFLVDDPVIDNPMLTVAKPEIKIGETNKYTATFKDNAQFPTKLTDIQYTTIGFPEFAIPDKDSVEVKIGGTVITVPAENIEFTTERALKITLPEIAAGAEVSISYNVKTTRATPPENYPAVVEQHYQVTGKRVDGKPIQSVNSMPIDFLIQQATATIEINYLMEGTNEPIPNEYSPAMSGDIGNESDLIEFDINNYVLTKVQFDGVDKLPMPTEAFKVKYGDVKSIDFYYSGVLKIKSAPSLYDFDVKEAKVNGMVVTDPTIVGDSLVVTDTRVAKQKWNLKAKVEKPLTSIENASVMIPSAIKYKNKDGEVSLNEFEETFFSETNTKDEYDVTGNNWSKGEGFFLDIPAGAIKSLGKYKAEIVITLEDAL